MGVVDREALIQDIYEAAAFPERWPAILEQIGRSADTPGIVLLTRRSDAWAGYAVSKPVEHDFLQYLATDIAARSQTTARLLGKDWSGFLSNLDLFSEQEWEEEPFRKEWGRTWGWNHAAATAIQIPHGDSLVVHVQRRDSEPAFDRRSIAALDSFRPHIARAGMLATRWRLQRLNAATEALALVGLPAAVLDRDGRVLAANQLMEATAHVRWLARGRIGLVDGHAQGLLQTALSGLFEPSKDAVQSFASRVSESDAAVVHVVPTSGQSQDLFEGGLAVLVVTPVAAPEAPDAPVIRALFDLSAGEARVARELTRGQTIDQIADNAGVTRETVRSQVKAVLAKTGTTRQAEVTALLAGVPKIRGRS
jgi:DNA-binding CsgD family transcriptional regulator